MDHHLAGTDVDNADFPLGETVWDDIDRLVAHAERHPEDRVVLDRIREAGIPVVTLFVSGRPLYTNPEINRSDAFVVAWLPGTQAGASADVLFRDARGEVDHDFRGTLPFSWPGAPCAVPLHPDVPDYAPLFPLGYGLDYDDGASAAADRPEHTPDGDATDGVGLQDAARVAGAASHSFAPVR